MVFELKSTKIVGSFYILNMELIQPKNKKQVVFLPENEVTYKYEQNKLIKVEK